MRPRWAKRARDDRRKLIGFVEQQSLTAALTLDERIEEAIGRLARFSFSGRRGRAAGTRELVVLRTPYVVIYSVDDRGVHIVRLIHGAQDWPQR